MRPVPNPKTARRAKARPVDLAPVAPAPGPVSEPAPPAPFQHRPPRPIGPEALKALREAIRNGTYPSDAAVRAGLERLIRRPE